MWSTFRCVLAPSKGICLPAVKENTPALLSPWARVTAGLLCLSKEQTEPSVLLCPPCIKAPLPCTSSTSLVSFPLPLLYYPVECTWTDMMPRVWYSHICHLSVFTCLVCAAAAQIHSLIHIGELCLLGLSCSVTATAKLKSSAGLLDKRTDWFVIKLKSVLYMFSGKIIQVSFQHYQRWFVAYSLTGYLISITLSLCPTFYFWSFASHLCV